MLIEIAATLDRFDRAQASEAVEPEARDPRVNNIYRALALLADAKTTPDRSERLLNLFSDLD
jgi:hypothetical protein